jgi:hypothetical protein
MQYVHLKGYEVKLRLKSAQKADILSSIIVHLL